MPQIPFAFQCSIPKNQLLVLKNSVDGRVKTVSVSNIPGFKYWLSIYPNGDSNKTRGITCVGLFLELGNVKKVEADYTILIESANYSCKTQCNYKTTGAWKHSVAKTDDFFTPEKKFIVDGKLTIKINGIFEFEAVDAPAFEEEQKWNGGELGNELWEEDGDRDFTIFVEGKELKVHKLLLRTRSDVFKAMFNSTMKETSENKVEITDFTFDVVETAVKLIYDCNFTSFLSLDEMMYLLQFFDKYNIPSLKGKVELLLINQISAATVCRLTNWSLTTNAINLKNKCTEFLVKSFVLNTPVSDIEILDNDVLKKIVQNMVYHAVEIQ